MQIACCMLRVACCVESAGAESTTLLHVMCRMLEMSVVCCLACRLLHVACCALWSLLCCLCFTTKWPDNSTNATLISIASCPYHVLSPKGFDVLQTMPAAVKFTTQQSTCNMQHATDSIQENNAHIHDTPELELCPHAGA